MLMLFGCCWKWSLHNRFSIIKMCINHHTNAPPFNSDFDLTVMTCRTNSIVQYHSAAQFYCSLIIRKRNKNWSHFMSACVTANRSININRHPKIIQHTTKQIAKKKNNLYTQCLNIAHVCCSCIFRAPTRHYFQTQRLLMLLLLLVLCLSFSLEFQSSNQQRKKKWSKIIIIIKILNAKKKWTNRSTHYHTPQTV